MDVATGRPHRRGWSNLLEERRFLAPALISPAVLGWAVYLSFTDAIGGSLSGKFVGFDNFVNVWHDANFQNALENTLIITGCSQVLVVAGAAILSHFLVRDFRGKWFLRFLVLLPWAAPVSLAVIGWQWILDSLFSVLNWTLAQLHLVSAIDPPQWLGKSNLALIAIIFVHAWRILPFAVVIFIAGLASIPSEVEDAAKIDGATGLKKLWFVTLPLQLPIALVAVLFGIVFTAADLTVVFILTHGGPFNSTQVLTTWAFQVGIESGSLGEGAAISLYLFPLLAVVSVLMLVFARRAQVS